MTVPELLRKAAGCRACGRPHDYLPDAREAGGASTRTWASLEDGHPYQPLVDANVVAVLRFLAAGKYGSSPWLRSGSAAHWWTEEIVQGP